jgi:23S rRNA pseudouridine955/2504/2580 synthase
VKHIIGSASGQKRRVPTPPVRTRAPSVPIPSAAPNHAEFREPSGKELPQATLVTVDEDYAGQRLDNFLIRQLKGVPKTHVYRIIRSGEVRINKGRAHADTRVEAGDVVRLPPVRTSERADQKAQAMQNVMTEVARHGASSTVGGYAPSREFPILFEDDFLLAIDKPAGVAVHGGSGVSFGVIEQLRMARPGAEFLELVHRLDRETSGILLIAKRRMALKVLQEQFRERETDKIYLALVSGNWPANLRVIDKALHKYLQPDGERRVKVVANEHPDGMRSVTLVKVKSVIAANAAAPATPFTLLEVTIKTGRTHQIRVHLAGEGHPIVGDDKYGDYELNRALQKSGTGAVALKRMFLHAWSLKFNHPKTRKAIHLLAGLPDELQQFLPARLADAASKPVAEPGDS